jgi:hypothetical protein
LECLANGGVRSPGLTLSDKNIIGRVGDLAARNIQANSLVFFILPLDRFTGKNRITGLFYCALNEQHERFQRNSIFE